MTHIFTKIRMYFLHILFILKTVNIDMLFIFARTLSLLWIWSVDYERF